MKFWNEKTMRIGFIAGLLISLYTAYAFYRFGDVSKLTVQQFKIFNFLGNLRYFMMILAIFIGVKQFKKSNLTSAYFGVLMITGLKITLIISIMVAGTELIYLLYQPDMLDKFGVAYLKELKDSGINDAEISKIKENVQHNQWMKTPLMNAFFYFLESAFVGLIASFAFATLLRTRNENLLPR